MTTAVLDQAAGLERVLLDHGITIFGYERLNDLAVVRFTMRDQKLRLVVPMPDYADDEFRLTPSRREIRSTAARNELYWTAVRKRWAAMKTLISAKLDAIDAGITTFEAEFSQFADGVAALGTGAG